MLLYYPKCFIYVSYIILVSPLWLIVAKIVHKHLEDMEIAAIPRESITCMMCRGSVQFNKNDQLPMYYNNHLKYHHGVYFHHDIYLGVNLLNVEFLQKIIDEFRNSEKLSDFTCRDDYLGEVVIDVEDVEDADGGDGVHILGARPGAWQQPVPDW